MKQSKKALSFFIIIFLMGSSFAYAADNARCLMHMDLAEEALLSKDYPNSLVYLESARPFCGEGDDIDQMIDLVGQLIDQTKVQEWHRLDLFDDTDSKKVHFKKPQELEPKEKISHGWIPNFNFFKKSKQKLPKVKKIKEEKKSFSSNREAVKFSKPAPVKSSERKTGFWNRLLDHIKGVETYQTDAAAVSKRERDRILFKEPETVVMSLQDAVAKYNLDGFVDINYKDKLILTGDHIKRFAVLRPDIFGVERLDSSRIQITPLKVADSLIHVWDSKKRWTFKMSSRRQILELYNDDINRTPDYVLHEPLKFTVSFDSYVNSITEEWGDFDGSTYSIRNGYTLSGETAYGDFDAGIAFLKSDKRTVVDYISVGLSDGKYKNFDDFSVRLGDGDMSVSELAVPNVSLRGAFFQKFIDLTGEDNEFIEVKTFWGKERDRVSLSSASNEIEEDLFNMGLRVAYIQKEKRLKAGLNMAHVYGDSLDPEREENIISADFEKRFSTNDVVAGELATNGDNYALFLDYDRLRDKYTYTVRFEDYAEDFSNISGVVSEQGRVGLFSSGNYLLRNNLTLRGNLDLYRNRNDEFSADSDALNTRISTGMNWRISKISSMTLQASYNDLPGENSAQETSRLFGSYSRQFPWILDRNIQTTFRASVSETTTNEGLATESGFSRLLTGAFASIPLAEHLDFEIDYSRSLFEDNITGEKSEPETIDLELVYRNNINTSWYLRSGLGYRTERDVQANDSLLEGEDIVSFDLTARYSPSDDFKAYVGLRAEERLNTNDMQDKTFSFNFGFTSDWETPWSINAPGLVEGRIFMDYNRNQIQDEGEEGLENISVQIGDQTVQTNSLGDYELLVKAKKVHVRIDPKSVPRGHLLTTDVSKEQLLVPHGVVTQNFGFVSHSGVIVVVFNDENGDGKKDREENVFAQVEMSLGNDKKSTDQNGVIIFDKVSPGKKTLKVKLQSIPRGFIPAKKVRIPLEVKKGETKRVYFPLKSTNQSEN